MSRRQRNIVIALCALWLIVGACGGALVGVITAAPRFTDIRNACVADNVVPHAGIPPGVTPGPRSVDTTPPVVTPPVRR